MSMHDGLSTKFVGIFTGTAEGPFRIDTAHIERVEFLKLMEVEAQLQSGSRSFTPTFSRIFPMAAPFLSA